MLIFSANRFASSALNSANLYHAEILILNVYDRLTTGYSPVLDVFIEEKSRQLLLDEHTKNVKKSIKKRLEVISGQEIKNNPEYAKILNSIKVYEGYPAETILTMAYEFDCDMIIMGTHSKGVLGHTFLGSTAKRVLRRTRKPIFIIPLPKGKSGIAYKDN